MPCRVGDDQGPVSVLLQWAEPAAPHSPPRGGQRCGEWSWAAVEMLLCRGMAGFWVGPSESHGGHAGLHQLRRLPDSHWSPVKAGFLTPGCLSSAGSSP